jgi:hypothetical protein
VNTFASRIPRVLVIDGAGADVRKNFVRLWPRSARLHGAVSQMKKSASLSSLKRAARSGPC